MHTSRVLLAVRPGVTGVLLGLALLTGSGAAFALAQRTFVASDGADANAASNCSIALPCRSFTAALGVTNAGGEIVVKDSAGYGPVSITQSVSIIAAPGIYAGISVLSGTGVSVGGSGVVVVLRGLSINGQGGTNGVSVSGVNSEVHVESPVISNMTNTAIQATCTGCRVYVTDAELRTNGGDAIRVTGGARVYVDRGRIEENGGGGAGVSNDGELYVRNSVVHRNQTGLRAIIFSGQTGTVRLVVERTLISGSSFGGINVQVQGNAPNRIDAVVTGTTIIDNSGAGFNGINFQCFGTASGVLTLTDSTISHHLASNVNGMQVVGGDCVASVGRTTFTRNETGMSGDTLTLTSFGNNEFDRNGTDIFGAYTTKATQ
jgi:hypothetical protein